MACLVAAIASAAAGSRLARARALCDALRSAETDDNDVTPWAEWLHAVGAVYLRYDRQELRTHDPLLACAAGGWKPDCVRRALPREYLPLCAPPRKYSYPCWQNYPTKPLLCYQ